MEGAPKEQQGEGRLVEGLEGTLEMLRQLTIIVEDFQQPPLSLFDRVNGLIGQYQLLESARHHVHDVAVPMHIFHHIDEGANPDMYLQECLQRCLDNNERTRGKLHLTQRLHDELQRSAGNAWPGLMGDAPTNMAKSNMDIDHEESTNLA